MGCDTWHDRLLVEDRKLTDYLLSEDHEHGASKARFFLGIDFSTKALGWFASALVEQAKSGKLSLSRTDFGNKYVIVGDILSPNGRSYRVRTVWIEDETRIRLVTAIPHGE